MTAFTLLALPFSFVVGVDLHLFFNGVDLIFLFGGKGLGGSFHFVCASWVYRFLAALGDSFYFVCASWVYC